MAHDIEDLQRRALLRTGTGLSLAWGGMFAAGVTAGCGGTTSDNARLESLTVSAGTLVPAFSQDVLAYSVVVGNAVTTVHFRPRSADGSASVKVQGKRVADGDTSADFDLAVGSNTFEILVRAEDGHTELTYTVTFVRTAASSSDAALYALLPSAGTLNPSFASTVTRYTVTVAQSVASIRFTPVSGNNPTSITVDGVAVTESTASAPVALSTVDTSIPIVVVSQDGSTTRTYTVVVTRAA